MGRLGEGKERSKPLTAIRKPELWNAHDYTQELWGGVNTDQLGGLWREISSQPPGRILEVALQAALKACGEEGIV